MIPSKKAYQSIFKSTSLFGGVQVVEIIMGVLRSKALAILIGAEGFGISSLLNTIVRLTHAISGVGLDKSAVREIAAATSALDREPGRTIAVLKKLVWFTGLVGAAALILFSKPLSLLSFSTTHFTYGIAWLGLAVIFNQLAASRLAFLQGLQQLRLLAKASLSAAFLSLIVTVLLYYFMGIDGIVPVIISTALLSFLTAQYFFSRVAVEIPALTSGELKSSGKHMARLGATLSYSAVLGFLVAYVIQVYIGKESTVTMVGYYSAGIVILNSYVGLIFKAMTTDYFPKLSAVSHSITKINETVYQQIFVALLLLTPIIVLFIAYAPLLIELLYASTFSPAIGLVRWGILGMIFKCASWSLGYVIIAKGDASLFLKTTTFFNIVLLVLNIVGFTYWGLEGVGQSLLIYYCVHFIIVGILVKTKYNLQLPVRFYGLFCVCLALSLAAFALTYVPQQIYKNVGFVCILVLSGYYSFRLLDREIGFKELITKLLSRKRS